VEPLRVSRLAEELRLTALTYPVSQGGLKLLKSSTESQSTTSHHDKKPHRYSILMKANRSLVEGRLSTTHNDHEFPFLRKGEGQYNAVCRPLKVNQEGRRLPEQMTNAAIDNKGEREARCHQS